MSTDAEDGLSMLAGQWRARARHFMDDAERTRRGADVVRLTAMASTLEWAASDLMWMARSPALAERVTTTRKESSEGLDA